MEKRRTRRDETDEQETVRKKERKIQRKQAYKNV
jgi:hypothetical protein